MKNAYRKKALALAILLAGSGVTAQAMAETINCTEITSLPTTIGTQGVYCLKDHLSTNLASGTAITVTTNNVTIDCNEYKLGNLAAGPATQATGILADSRINVTVRNCGIRGFRSGAQLTNGLYRVEDNRFDHNMQGAIRVGGDGSVVRRNEVVDTGGSTAPGADVFFGISVEGNVDVTDNLVSGVVATTGGLASRSVYGIFANNMNAGLVQNNRVRQMTPYNLLGNRHGIFVQSGTNNTVAGNTIVMGTGLLATDTGIRCGSGLLGVVGGIARDNVILQAGLLGSVGALLNCTSVLGGNYVDVL
jgi:hypothetical protein